MNARDAIEDALREIQVLDPSDAMGAEHIPFGLRKLGRMLTSWQSLGYNLWLKAEQTLTLTTARVYTLNPERPLRIHSARLSVEGVETPLQELTRQEYDEIPIKTMSGRPSSFYYDRQREAARFYVWPVPLGGDTIKITYEREIGEPGSLSAELDIPGEWERAVVLALAVDLAPAYSRPPPVEMAAGALSTALAFDREGSVFFT